jgi:probable phosphoglycerate mutase
MSTTILLVRHGQTEWNRVERFRGRVDVPLNDTGLRQAEATGRHVADFWRPVALYSSPLSRAVKTAEAIGRNVNLAVEIHPGLIDIDYGDWQSLTPDEARSQWPDMVDAWYKTPHLAFIPGGETLVELRVRAMRTVRDLAARHAGQTILLVSHTVINRIILMCVMGIGNERLWRIRQEPCAINVFEVDTGEYTLVSLNDTCHLSELTSK